MLVAFFNAVNVEYVPLKFGSIAVPTDLTRFPRASRTLVAVSAQRLADAPTATPARVFPTCRCSATVLA